MRFFIEVHDDSNREVLRVLRDERKHRDGKRVPCPKGSQRLRRNISSKGSINPVPQPPCGVGHSALHDGFLQVPFPVALTSQLHTKFIA